MTGSRLVRNGRHMRPMWAVLERYRIGSKDKYNRGRWIMPEDLEKIEEKMNEDPSRMITGSGIWVQGSNIHNHVNLVDFYALWEE